MSATDLLRAATHVRTHGPAGVVAETGEGTGLAEAMEAAGTAALVGLVGGDALRVELEDDDVAVDISRAGGRILVRTRWRSGEALEQDLGESPRAPVTDLAAALATIRLPLTFRDGGWVEGNGPGDVVVPALAPERLGSPAFRAEHGLRACYLAGAMAGGIGSAALVTAMGRAGYLAFFGAGGLDLDRVREGVRSIRGAAPDSPAGFNLLHNPAEPRVEEATVDLYLEHGVRTIDASAYLGLTPAVVRFRLHGIHERDGRIITPHRVLAKVSRPEVAEHFLRPAPARILDELVASGALTARQAELAAHLPVATDVTAEADSGGHTDGRPLSVLLPVFRRLVDRVTRECGYARAPRVGAAGGIGDPWSFAAALQLGADYVMTGSINQATVEAGTSTIVKGMLAEAGYADVARGPAPDMFEMGAEVQVLSRGSMYAQRAARLYELYRAWPSLEAIPEADRVRVEKQIFQRSLADVWTETEAYWRARDPREVERALGDPRHQMALCFRWYLGMTSRWARAGEATRKRDFQVWCGPAMGLFNDWVRGSWLEPLAERTVVAVADSLLHGACVATRVNLVRAAGLEVPAAALQIVPYRG